MRGFWERAPPRYGSATEIHMFPGKGTATKWQRHENGKSWTSGKGLFSKADVGWQVKPMTRPSICMACSGAPIPLYAVDIVKPSCCTESVPKSTWARFHRSTAHPCASVADPNSGKMSQAKRRPSIGNMGLDIKNVTNNIAMKKRLVVRKGYPGTTYSIMCMSPPRDGSAVNTATLKMY